VKITIEVTGNTVNDGKFLYDILGEAQRQIPSIDTDSNSYNEGGLAPFDNTYQVEASARRTKIRMTYEP
jgi:hypothetical protein